MKNPGYLHTDTQGTAKPFTVEADGFSLNTAVACAAHQRARLERLCRYVTRPAVCQERLSVRADGTISYELNHPFRDGTTHVLFTPPDFLARLAALVPSPRAHLTRYHGVFAPNSRFRTLVVPGAGRARSREYTVSTLALHPAARRTDHAPTAPLSWAERLKRVFDLDISVCPLCGGTLRVIGDVTDPHVIDAILVHLKQRAPPPDAPDRTGLDDPQHELFVS